MEVYLDNSATTACLPEVAKLMTRILCEEYGNPSAMHLKGVEAGFEYESLLYVNYVIESVCTEFKA